MSSHENSGSWIEKLSSNFIGRIKGIMKRLYPYLKAFDDGFHNENRDVYFHRRNDNNLPQGDTTHTSKPQ